MEVIKRENGLNDEIQFSLRLMKIDKEKCNHIRNVLNKIYQIEINTPYDDKKYQLVLFSDIDNYDDYSKIVEVIHTLSIKKEHINISISMTTACDMSGFTLPQKISDLYLNLGGSIDFSIIFFVKE